MGMLKNIVSSLKRNRGNLAPPASTPVTVIIGVTSLLISALQPNIAVSKGTFVQIPIQELTISVSQVDLPVSIRVSPSLVLMTITDIGPTVVTENNTPLSPSSLTAYDFYEATVNNLPVMEQIWVYLPIGYENNTRNYPLIAFYHGFGERGSNIGILLTGGTGLIREISQGQEHPCIVIAPQLPIDNNTWPDWYCKLAVDFAKANFRVDANRVYATGLSLGGEACYKYANAYGSEVAAIMPVAGNSNVATGNTANFMNMPIISAHGTADTTVGPSSTVNLINTFNLLDPKPTYAPVAELLFGFGHSGTFWNNNVYRKSAAYFKWEDWLLKYSIDYDETCTLHTERAETTLDLHDYLEGVKRVSALSAGALKTSLEGRLAAVKAIIEPGTSKRFVIDLGQAALTSTGNVNNLTDGTSGVISNIIDVDGVASTIDLAVLQKGHTSTPESDFGVRDSYMGLSENTIRDNFRVLDSGVCIMKFSGMDNGKLYRMRFYPSDRPANFVLERGIKITINGVSKSVYGSFNCSKFAEFLNLSPSGGEIQFTFEAKAPSSFGYLAAIVLTELSSGATPIVVGVETLSVIDLTVKVRTEVTVKPSIETLTIVDLTPTILLGTTASIAVGVETLTITDLTPTIIIEINTTVTPSIEVITSSDLPPGISVGGESIVDPIISAILTEKGISQASYLADKTLIDPHVVGYWRFDEGDFLLDGSDLPLSADGVIKKVKDLRYNLDTGYTARDFVQNTPANRPNYSFTNRRMEVTEANAQGFESLATGLTANGFECYAVCSMETNTSCLWGNPTLATRLFRRATGNYRLNMGTDLSISGANSNIRFFRVYANGATSEIQVDSSTVSGNANSNYNTSITFPYWWNVSNIYSTGKFKAFIMLKFKASATLSAAIKSHFESL